MTPDPKDKIFVVGSTGVGHAELLKALGTGVQVVTIDGPVAMPEPKPPTVETLIETLKAKRDEDVNRTLSLARAGLLTVVTSPISGGHHNGQRRNEPCHCGSGRKWKKCCGAPVNVGGMKLVAVSPQKGMS